MMHKPRALSLLFLAGALASGAAHATAAASFYGSTATGKTFNHPNPDLHSLSGQVTQFQEQKFFVDHSATCSIYGTQNGSFNGLVYVYRGDLDPSNPLTNLVAASDDGDLGAGSSTIRGLALDGNQNYSLVTTGNVAGATGTFTNTVSCGGANHVLAGEGVFPAYDGTYANLNSGRFQIHGTWRDSSGNTGNATFVPLGSDDSGIVWFFDPANFEMMIKVLNACGTNNRYWVFWAALTNVEFHVTVVDTWKSATRQYDNPLGTQAGSELDTDAFATCP